MKIANSLKIDAEHEPLFTLLDTILNDPVINNKVDKLLKLDSYPRHIVLSNWLEQLRLNKAPHKLTQTLTYLFDDSIAEKVYNLLNRSKVKK